jgi:hypothetical protein
MQHSINTYVALFHDRHRLLIQAVWHFLSTWPRLRLGHTVYLCRLLQGPRLQGVQRVQVRQGYADVHLCAPVCHPVQLLCRCISWVGPQLTMQDVAVRMLHALALLDVSAHHCLSCLLFVESFKWQLSASRADAACPTPKCKDCIDTECEAAECVAIEGGYSCVKTRAHLAPLPWLRC